LKVASRAELLKATANAAAVLCDWDGCLAIDNRLQPGVVDFLRQTRHVSIISNNSTMTRKAFQRQLTSEGVDVALRDIHLAGETLLEHAAKVFGEDPVYLIANAAMRRAARRLGLNLADQAPKAVLLLRDPLFDYGKLERAANHVREGAHFWIANPDLHHPSGDRLVPETGALAQAIAAIAGRPADRVIGKPERMLFEQALAALHLSPAEVVMIGDNPATDIVGAVAVNIRAVLVGAKTWRMSGDRPWPVVISEIREQYE
jgi:HAD superfamily hydrolase (TIGR01450 family)